MNALIVVQIRNNEVTATVLCCSRGSSASDGKWWLYKGDQRRSSRPSELREYNNCEPKKEIITQPHFRIIVSLYRKGSFIRTHSHIHAQTLTYTTRTHRRLLIFRAHMHGYAHLHADYTNKHKRSAQTQSKADELYSVSNWKHSQSQFLPAVEACISRHKRLLGLPEWLA